MPNDFLGLSTLGLTQPSNSSKVDDVAQPDLLGQMLAGSNSILDETAKSRILESQISTLNQQPDQGLLERLLSPQGLAALAGIIGAGVAGGGQAAAGFGAGSLQGIAARAEADKAAKRKAIDELEGRLDKSNQRLDAARNRVATLFNTNPDAFVNPITGEQVVSPDVLGFYMTGLPIPQFATTRRVLNQRDQSWEKQLALLTDALKDSRSEGDASNVLGAIFKHMGQTPPPGLTDTLARSFGTPEWTPAVVNTLADYAGPTFIDAAVYAGENGLDLLDPRVLKMMRFHDPSLDADKITPNDRFLDLAREINAWQADPANLDRVRELRAEHPGDEGAFTRAVSQEVLGGRQGDLAIWNHEAGLKDPNEFAQDLMNFKFIADKYGLGTTISGLSQTETLSKVPVPEQMQKFWGMAQQETENQNKLARDNQMKQDTAIAGQVASRLQKETGLAAADANAVAGEIMKRALRAATRPDGKVDRVRFEQEVKKLTDEGIAGVKE